MDKKRKLLIIDDNEELLAALESFFTVKGYAVETAPNGLEGLRIFRSEPQEFDLLITDIVMPYVSGVGIISIIKNSFPDFPIIAITGWGEFPEALATEAKADRVLQKPFPLVKLEKIVMELLESAKSG